VAKDTTNIQWRWKVSIRRGVQGQKKKKSVGFVESIVEK
jgi:hypothetical protein